MNYAQGDDGSLLQLFAETGNEEPFNELITRHGALVYGVSHRVLGQTQDAEDATQAVFLTLAEKAASLRGYKSVAGWLHHTAWNISRCARKAALCRKNREQETAAMRVSRGQPNAADAASNEWEQIKPLLDLELETLPEKYRVPLILHHVEGRTQSDVARLLGVTGGALSRRLSQAEELLRQRLERRGATYAPALLFAMILRHAPVPMPAGLAVSTGHAIARARAGASQFSPEVNALHKGALQSMFVKKAAIAASFLVAALLAGGAAKAMFSGATARAPLSRIEPLAPIEAVRTAVASTPNAAQKSARGNEAPQPATLTSPVAAQSDPEIAAWIAQLGSETLDERVAAMQNLRNAGDRAQAALKEASEKGAGEAKARAATLLGVLKTAAALQKIASENAKMKNYEADIETMKLAGGLRVSGNGHLKAIPSLNRYVVDTTSTVGGMSLKGRTISDGANVWNEMDTPMGKRAMKSKTTGRELLSLELNNYKQSYDFISSREDKLSGHAALVFTGVIREDDAVESENPYTDGYVSMKFVTAYVDAKDHLLRKIEIKDDKDVVTSAFTYSSIKCDGVMDAAQFTYVPAADVEVWDADNPKPKPAAPEPAVAATPVVDTTASRPATDSKAPIGATDTAALLQKIDVGNKAIATFEADEESVRTMQGLTMTSKSHIKDIAAAHRFAIDETSTMAGLMNIPSRMVCDGSTIYDEHSFPETGTKLRKSILKLNFKDYPRDEPSLNLNNFKDIVGDDYEFTASREETIDDQTLYVFSGVMRERKPGEKPGIPRPNNGKNTCTARVDAKDLLLRNIEIKDDKGVTIESIKYTNVKRDVTIDETAFLYSPPAGVKVIDIDDMKKPRAIPEPQPNKATAKQTDF